jgi:multiple sugar transport system substrate-binding protein
MSLPFPLSLLTPVYGILVFTLVRRTGELGVAERLRILLVGGPMYDPLYGRLAEFEESAEVRIEPVVVPSHPELNERIEEEFGSGTASYDLVSTHAKYAPSQKQWLTPLDGDLDASELGRFAPRTLELARIGGELYGVPRNLDVKLLYHRTDLVPEPPSSWEELREVAARLRGGDHYGFVFPGKESGLFGHFFELHAMHGGRMFEDVGRPAPKMNDEAGVWALGLLKDLCARAAPQETPDWHYDEVAACFREGGAAMSTDWPGGFYTYEDPVESAVAGRYAVALYPEGRAGRFIYSGSHTFAIPTTVRDRPAAVELLRFLTSRESQAFEAGLGTLPARSDALEDVRSAAEAGSLAEKRWELLEEAQEAALVPPKHPNYPAVEDEIWQGIREALLGNKSVEEALEATEEAARRAAEGR